MTSNSSSDSCSDNDDYQRSRKPKRYKRPLDADYNEHEVSDLTRKRYLAERSQSMQLEQESSSLTTSNSTDYEEHEDVQQSDREEPHSENINVYTNYFASENDEVLTDQDRQDSQRCTNNDTESVCHSVDSGTDNSDDDNVGVDFFSDDTYESSSSSSCTGDSDIDNDIDETIDERDRIFESVMFEQSGLKVCDIVTMISAFSLRFHLSDEGRLTLADMFKLCAGPAFETLNLSKYKMERCVSNQDEHIQYNYYCTKCSDTILLSTVATTQWKRSNIICDKCREKHSLTKFSSNYFISIDIAHQLKQILQNEELLSDILKNLQIRNNNGTNDELITDFSGGEILQQIYIHDESKNSEYLITLNFSTDGAPLTKSGKNSFWPLQLTVNNLSPKLRYRNILLAGILIVKKEPKPKLMNLFMSVFTKQLKKLYDDGITMKVDCNEITFTFCTHSCIVDSVCRPVMQNRLQFNGYNGCSWCYQQGLYVYGCGIRYVVMQSSDELRSNISHTADVKAAIESGKIIRGVKGESELQNLPHFDMVWSLSYEYMHALLLGACLQIFNEWKSGNSEFKISKKDLERIEKRFLFITPNKEIHRLPRSGIILGTSKPKASELKSWLLYYSLPCLVGIIPEEALNHYALLVNSAYTLLKSEISETDLKICEENLLKFVVFYEMHYGKESMTFNIHTLLHVCQSVRKTGLLWANSAFSFESNIYTLKTYVKGPKGMDRQMARKSLQTQMFKTGNVKLMCENKTKRFIISLYNPHRLTRFYNSGVENVIYVGRGRKVADFPANSLAYTKCIFNGSVYHSTKYTRSKKTNDTVVQLHDGSFGIILEILRLNDSKCYLKMLPLIIVTENPFENITHIKKVEHSTNISNNHILLSINLIKTKAILINNLDNSASYVCTAPNNIEIQ